MTIFFYIILAQGFLNYFFLAFIYSSILFFRPGEHNFGVILRKRGWKYFALALVDVHANFLMVKAYQYTNLTSIQVLKFIFLLNGF